MSGRRAFIFEWTRYRVSNSTLSSNF